MLHNLPIGLAAAAHLLARGEPPVVFEAGDAIAQSLRAWAHVHMFSPWEFNVDQAAADLLAAAGWTHPPKETLPTGGERVELQLPETDVCSTLPPGSTVLHPLTLVQATSCCGGPVPAESDACCVQDAEAKATGQAGCGCGATDTRAAAPAPTGSVAKTGE